jgi:hypothetical protein
LREYRPDYGLDFTIEVFKTGDRPSMYETLGEHLFVQLKSVAVPEPKPLAVFARGNVEKGPETLDRTDKVADIETYRFQLETPDLTTVERMGIAVPVLLIIADTWRPRHRLGIAPGRLRLAYPADRRIISRSIPALVTEFPRP